MTEEIPPVRSGELLHKRFASYFLPTILMTMALSMSVVAAGIIVGNLLGPDALAAVSLAMPLTLAFSVLYCVFGIGGSVLVAYHKGRREHDAANAVFTTAVICLILAGLALMFGGILWRDGLANLLAGGNPGLRELVHSFIGPLFYGAPIMILLPGLVYFIRTDGRPRLAASILILANLLALGGDFLFLWWLKDIKGAALATVTGYTLSALLLPAYFLSPNRELCLVRPLAGFLGRVAGLTRAGFPNALSMGLQLLRTLCINSLVLTVAGKTGMVAFSVCISSLSLAAMFINGAAQTLMPIAGVLWGEGDYAGIRLVFRRALLVLLTAAGLLVAVLELFPGGLLRLFGVDGADNLRVGVEAVRIFAPSLLGCAFVYLMIMYAQTIRRPGFSMAISLVESFLVVVPAAWLLAQAMGLTGIWLAFSVAELVAVAAIFLLVRRISAASGGQVQGLLMLPDKQAAASASRILDVTIGNTVDAALGLSETVGRLVLAAGYDENLAVRLGLVVEELALNVVRHGGNPPGRSHIDIAVAMGSDEARVSFRDDGKPFNPTACIYPDNNGLADAGLPLVRKVAGKLEYSFALGFNNTVVTLPAKPPAGSPR